MSAPAIDATVSAAAEPYLIGQSEAAALMACLATACPTGDELYHYVRAQVVMVTPTDDATLRGFLRAIQKRLEKLS